MDKTSMTLGWLTGRMIARQMIAGQRPTETPVMYSYNGFLFPPIPERDLEKYPCAFILMRYSFVGYPSGASLYLTNDITIGPYDEKGNNAILIDRETTVYYHIDVERGTGNAKDTQWGDLQIPLSSALDESIVRWTNTSIYKSDGTLLMAASDPVPVYE